MTAVERTVNQPTVTIRIESGNPMGDSVLALNVTGEVLEAVDYLDDGTPVNWDEATVSDDRAYLFLRSALRSAEDAVRLRGREVTRVGD